MLPNEIIVIDALPKLGSGKCDYVSVDRLVSEHFFTAS